MDKIAGFDGRWRFLSNFYISEIIHHGIKYPSMEAYYVAMKINSSQIIDGIQYTLNDAREMISKVETPGQVKRLGRKLQLRSDWDSVKLSVMECGLRQKFSKDPLRQMLLDTDNAILIESNYWHDTFWGICICPTHLNKGENNLGKLLMKIRNEMK